MRYFYIFLICLSIGATTHCYAQRNVEFIQNKGQWGDWFEYRAETAGGDICLENSGFRFILADRGNKVKLDSFHHGHIKQAPKLRFHTYKVTFEGAQKPKIVPLKPQATYYNYYLGNDPKRWKTGIHPHYAIDYKDIYQNIDMHLASQKGNLVYEFMVKPGAKASDVQL